MTELFTSIKFYTQRYPAEGWNDITSDVLYNPAPRGSMGIMRNGLMDRVADGGRLTIALKNDDGYYSTNVIGIQDIEAMIKMECTWDGVTAVKFIGYYEPGTKRTKISPYGERYVEITYRDWMAWAIEYELDFLDYATSKRIDQGVQLLLNKIPMSTMYKTFDTGYYTFPDLFDTMGGSTTVGGEFTKLANSELGYIYQKYRADGDDLTVLCRTTRRIGTGGTGALTQFPKYSGDHDGDYFLMEDGSSKYLMEDGSSWYLMEDNENITLTVADLLEGGMNEIVKDAHLTNYAKISVRPRSYDADSTTVLWTMESAQLVAAGTTISGIRGRYRDPTGGASYINAINLTQPIAGTDYEAFENEDGTGADLTANLQVVMTYGTAEVEFALTNTGATDLYTGGPDINFQVRGQGVYVYDAMEMVRDLGDVRYYSSPVRPYGGRQTESFDLYYQTDANEVLWFLSNAAYWNNIPRECAMGLEFMANQNTNTMRLWMYGGVGVSFTATLTNTFITYNQAVYINGLNFEVIAGKYINFQIVPFESARAVISDI